MDQFNSVLDKMSNIKFDDLKNLVDLAIDDREASLEFMGILFFTYYSTLNPVEKSNLISKLVFQFIR